ncbi:MAG: TonB-dependent receptor [Flavobacteriaceae bacterium]|nr:TonB-dependent receptor [Flavobacteriaceae bacterium]
MKTFFPLILFLFCLTTYSQTTVTGNVVDNNSLPILGANVIVTGTTQGTVTDFDGNFTLTVSEELPFTIEISSVGYETKSFQVTTNNQVIAAVLNEGSALDEIVISASRTPERIFESPVTVERFGLKEIKNTAAASFYEGLENLKGVDINVNSLTFQSVNTRGFATFANTRFVQLVDGMDNAAPVLNFPLGNLLGMTELDVHSIELLPGASSALYGANAFNGILFMTSKNPFDFEGISGYYKQGVTSQEAAGDNSFFDVGVRVAKKFSDKFAAKANFSFLKGTDWHAVNEEDVLNPGRDRSHPNYDGLNVYGDEVFTNIKGVGQSLADLGIIPAGAVNLLPSENVSRTGYAERDLTDYNAESVKFDAGLYYRPWGNDFEISYLGKIGVGSTIYQGANRYAINNFFLQQHKIEFKNDNFFIRGYITDEDAGDSYDTRFTAVNLNRQWKSDSQWFGQYAGAFIQGTLAGLSPEQAHALGRQTADTGRFEPGTEEFKNALNKVTNDPNPLTGGQFKDASQLRHADANYNFTHLMPDIAEVQVGGSFREYKLNSFGTIFTDADGPISYNEYGAYLQVQKKLVDDRLKLTGSVRYDESELFEGSFSPRFSIAYSAGEKRNHNIRGSVQTGFRNPTTQDLFIGLDVGRAILVGSAEANLDRYVRPFPISGAGAAATGSSTATISGRDAYENAFSLSSINAGAPEAANVDLVEPEQVTAIEVGYRARLGKVILDMNVYYNQYQDFISNETVIVPLYGEVGDNSLSLLALQQGDVKPFQTYTNSDADVKSYGATVGAGTKVFGNFDFDINYTFAEEDFDQASAPDFRTSFNTPKHKVKASFGNTDVVKNLGFNINYRWSDAFEWQATFADGNVPAYSVVDAQINYRIPVIKSTLKVGAANIGNNEYFTAFGTGLIGTQYYVSLSINNL